MVFVLFYCKEMATILVEKYQSVTDPRLGRHIEHDPRSLQYPFRAARKADLKSIRHVRHIPIFDQGQLGSCTGNAAVGCLGTGEFWSSVLPILKNLNITLDEDFAVDVYSEATKIDPFPGEYPPEDTGSSGLSVAKVLNDKGLISGYTHALSFDDLLAALQERPVIAGTNFYNNMFNPDANGIVTVPDGDSLAGGHEYILDEVDMGRSLIGATNSWGVGWGLSGRFYLPFDLVKRLLAEDGDVTVFVPLTQAPPTPVPVDDDAALWASVKDWVPSKHTLTKNKKVAAALSDWATKKGYSA